MYSRDLLKKLPDTFYHSTNMDADESFGILKWIFIVLCGYKNMGFKPPQVDRHIHMYCTPLLAFEVERMIEKGWVGVKIGKIVATRLSE